MIERIAKAIYEARVGRFPNVTPDWGILTENTRENFRNEARAALEAMKEPTRAVQIAGMRAEPDSESIWYVMIKQALEN